MKHRRYLVLLLCAALLCSLLAGCQGVLKNETLDEQADIFLTAMSEGDPDMLFGAFYPGCAVREEFDQAFAQMQDNWQGEGASEKKLLNFQITTNNDGKKHTGQYLVRFENVSYVISLAYLENDQGSGLLDVRFQNADAEKTVVSGNLDTAGDNSVIQWVLLAVSAAEFAFVVWTLVDILRKKPKKYGLWLLAAILEVTMGFVVRGGTVSLRFNLGLFLAKTQYLVFANGTGQLVLMVPLGALVYWSMRKKLLAEKAPQPERTDFNPEA